jgi:hypothetical protein
MVDFYVIFPKSPGSYTLPGHVIEPRFRECHIGEFKLYGKRQAKKNFTVSGNKE